MWCSKSHRRGRRPWWSGHRALRSATPRGGRWSWRPPRRKCQGGGGRLCRSGSRSSQWKVGGSRVSARSQPQTHNGDKYTHIHIKSVGWAHLEHVLLVVGIGVLLRPPQVHPAPRAVYKCVPKVVDQDVVLGGVVAGFYAARRHAVDAGVGGHHREGVEVEVADPAAVVLPGLPVEGRGIQGLDSVAAALKKKSSKNQDKCSSGSSSKESLFFHNFLLYPFIKC